MPHAEEYTVGIDAGDTIEFLFVVLPCVGDMPFDAGVAEQAVDAAVAGLRRFDIGFDIRGLADVGPPRRDLRTRALQLVLTRRERLRR